MSNNDEDDDNPFAVFDAPSSLNVSSNSQSTIPTISNLKESNSTSISLDSSLGFKNSNSSISITEALNQGGKTSSASIMSVVYASSNTSNISEDDTSISEQKQRLKSTGILKEPNSGIRVSHPTKSCEQLSILLVQNPFCGFTELQRALIPGSSSSSFTIVGVVIRKSDPKQKNGKHAYGIISIWNMRGPFPTSSEELSILFCGSAFDLHYTKLANGVVLALSNIQLMENRTNSSVSSSSSLSSFPATNNNNNNNNNNSQLLKVVKNEQVRVLGFAADISTCQGIQQRSGERCNSVVNGAISKFCSHHVSNLRREARGGNTMSSHNKSKINTSRNLIHSTTTNTTTIPISQKNHSMNSAIPPVGIRRMNLAALNPAGPSVPRGSLQAFARQQSGFLTVRGACGLPTTSSSSSSVSLSDMNSPGGPYAGVTAGGALPLHKACHGVTSVVGFTSPAALGVTGRGRAVLAAAAAAEEARETRRLLQRAMMGGGGETTTTTTTTTTTSSVGVKRNREEGEEEQETIRGRGVTGGGATTTKVAISSVQDELDAVRAQFAPLTGSKASTAFAPMRNSGFEEVQLRQQDYQNRIITKRSNGATSAIVSAVEKELRKGGALANSAASLTHKNQKEKEEQEQQQIKSTTSQPSSLLGKVAESMQSVNDELRGIDERRQFEKRMERRLLQDKALETLSEVKEQKIKALYCRQCDRWYLRRNERCKTQHHTLETKETTRHFIECEHCSYKTSILGDVRPSKMIPRCPRCCAEASWRASNAAPELAVPREIPPQL